MASKASIGLTSPGTKARLRLATGLATVATGLATVATGVATLATGLVAGLALAGLSVTAVQAADQAGVSAAVRGDVQLVSVTAPKTVGHKVKGGEDIYLGDRIRSEPDSGMQVLLLDETTFTIGPSSDLTIDKFIYDPKTNAGKVSATLGRGVFRFISGKIAHNQPSNMVVKTPIATIGVRGTTVYGRIGATGGVIALGGPGPDNNTGDPAAGVDIFTPDGDGHLRRPGWGIIITPGKPPFIGQLTPAMMQSLIGAVSPRPPAKLPPLPTGNAGPLIIQATGQATAAALTSIQTVSTIGEVTGDNTSTDTTQSNPASPSTIIPLPTNPTTFNQLAAITSGFAYFDQYSVPIYDVSASTTSLQTIGNYSFSLYVDFASRYVSGSFYNIDVPTLGIAGMDYVDFNATYQASSAPAAFYGINPSCGTGGATCTGVTVLQNGASGTVAETANHSLSVTNGTVTGVGYGVAPRTFGGL